MVEALVVVLEDVLTVVAVVRTDVVVVRTEVTDEVRTEDVVVLETVVVVLELDTGPPGPLTLESPVFCRLAGRRGWISFCHTVVYSPGVPSEAVLPGSKLPH